MDYKGDYSELIKHMKMDDAFNFGLYKQLCKTLKYRDYELRCAKSGFIPNIGSYDR